MTNEISLYEKKVLSVTTSLRGEIWAHTTDYIPKCLNQDRKMGGHLFVFKYRFCLFLRFCILYYLFSCGRIVRDITIKCLLFTLLKLQNFRCYFLQHTNRPLQTIPNCQMFLLILWTRPVIILFPYLWPREVMSGTMMALF